MAKHKVHQGECLITVARRYGLPWKKIWEDPNNAELKRLRGDPDILLPGDELSIPERDTKLEQCPTKCKNAFRAHGSNRYLRLALQNARGQPLAGKPYVLTVAGTHVAGAAGAPAKTDANGEITCKIPPDARIAELTVEDDKWVLELSALDPIDTIQGLQGRLANLNYEPGPIDGVEGPRTVEAVRNFQRDNDLVVDGKYGPRTQTKLKEIHKS